MCFSAESSFTSGTILTIAGIILIKKFKTSRALLLALIPLFFGIQQLAEGWLWHAFEHHSYPDACSLISQRIFLFFAYMFWPVWMPLAFGIVEKVLWRRVMMFVLMILGLGFFFERGYNFYISGDAVARIVNHSIDYGRNPLGYLILYATIAFVPFLLSSIPKMWILGIINVIVFIIANISYNYAFTSIWCFAAAIITIGLFILLKVEPVQTIDPKNGS